MQLPDRIDHAWLRSQAARPREARIESVFPSHSHLPCLYLFAHDSTSRTLLSERQDHLSNLFIALRDKPRPYEFEAGLKGRKRRKLAREGQAEPQVDDEAEQFMRRYQDLQK